jgi:hypothetical protein
MHLIRLTFALLFDGRKSICLEIMSHLCFILANYYNIVQWSSPHTSVNQTRLALRISIFLFPNYSHPLQ